MALRTDRTTRISSAVASLVTTNHAVKGSVFVNLLSAGNLRNCFTRSRSDDFEHLAVHGAEYGRDTGFEPFFREREFLIDNLPVRIHLIIEMILVDRPCAFPHSSCAGYCLGRGACMATVLVVTHLSLFSSQCSRDTQGVFQKS